MAGFFRSHHVISGWIGQSPVPPMPPSRGQSIAGISSGIEQEASAIRRKSANTLRIIWIGLTAYIVEKKPTGAESVEPVLGGRKASGHSI